MTLGETLAALDGELADVRREHAALVRTRSQEEERARRAAAAAEGAEAGEAEVGFGRIIVSEREAPTLSANLVSKGWCAVEQSDNATEP
jgi:hypothetical protein